MGLVVVFGSGMNFSTFEGFGMLTGFGNLPLLPRLHRLRDIVISYFVVSWRLYVNLVVP